ncbi:MAE_28990/MAE_18760 family HEPN-like nuclease [Stutzerimonas frequens]|uniref:MAE_28990/MAE_18760 family HEPN-like nuclease n=1 Tax=Stutzerimonas frequens TaxID=2968969 RepID=UPI002DB6B19A|nr:MAE_28990/MAE_18760 family HEPN-like nuclease [Stutzerimonas frequens]WRW27357.1 MAE_28990/MAE_18760 family HEPN-like nuclease [Stutzerimonas frequens]
MRTIDHLLSAIADDLIWRRKEITELRALIQKHRGQLKERVLIRAAVALLYAHWEGFVKKCGTYYLEYVSYQRVECDKLSANFLALAARGKVVDYIKNGDIALGVHLADFYLGCAGKQSRVPYKKVVDTQSNLGSSALKNILSLLGLEKQSFSTKMAFIDSNLVNPRNHVAHGEVLDISFSEYEGLHDDVLGLIESFRNEVENAAINKAYLRQGG